MGGSHLHKATSFVNTQEPCVHGAVATSYMRKMWLQGGEKPGRLKPDWGKQETLVRGHCYISPIAQDAVTFIYKDGPASAALCYPGCSNQSHRLCPTFSHPHSILI